MDFFLGEIILGGWNYAPQQTVYCNGQTMLINGNEALYSLIGSLYGGDGRTTLGIPDLRGRSAIQQGRLVGSDYDFRLGWYVGGNLNQKLTLVNMPEHTHEVKVTGGLHTGGGKSVSSNPEGNFLGQSSAVDPVYRTSSTNNTLGGADGINVFVETNGTTNQKTFSIQKPYLALNYCMVIEGIYPARN